MNRKRKNDIILAVAIIILAAVGLISINVLKKDGNAVVIKIDGVKTEKYEITQNIKTTIKTGKDGEYENVLVIKDGKAFVESANCPDKVCVGHNAISFVGETIVCLPHKVVIEIVGDTQNNVDAAV